MFFVQVATPNISFLQFLIVDKPVAHPGLLRHLSWVCASWRNLWSGSRCSLHTSENCAWLHSHILFGWSLFSFLHLSWSRSNLNTTGCLVNYCTHRKPFAQKDFKHRASIECTIFLGMRDLPFGHLHLMILPPCKLRYKLVQHDSRPIRFGKCTCLNNCIQNFVAHIRQNATLVHCLQDSKNADLPWVIKISDLAQIRTVVCTIPNNTHQKIVEIGPLYRFLINNTRRRNLKCFKEVDHDVFALDYCFETSTPL